jgi:hypothetical protein
MGLQIGSGSMESGCKQNALARLKIAGTQWSLDGAAFLSHEVNFSCVALSHIA